MKKVSGILLFLLLSIGYSTFGQSVNEVRVKYKDTLLTGFQGTYQVSKSDLSKIAGNYFSDKFLKKAKKDKGYLVYPGVGWSVLPLASSDVYYSVSGNKSNANLTLLISKGYNNFADPATDPQVAQSVKMFLATDFVEAVNAYVLSQEIKSQKSTISSMQKTNSKALKKQNNLKKKIAKMQDQVESLQKEMDNRQVQIQSNQAVLDNLMNQK